MEDNLYNELNSKQFIKLEKVDEKKFRCNIYIYIKCSGESLIIYLAKVNNWADRYFCRQRFRNFKKSVENWGIKKIEQNLCNIFLVQKFFLITYGIEIATP